MDLFADFHGRTRAALVRIAMCGSLPDHLDLSGFTVEPPRDPSCGDLAINAALVHGRSHALGARGLAAALVRDLGRDPDVASAAVAGAGFVNIALHPRCFGSVLAAALAEGYGRGPSRPGIPVAVRSAVPTAPASLDRHRVAVVADALARLLAFAGHDVLPARGAPGRHGPEVGRGEVALREAGQGTAGPGPPSEAPDGGVVMVGPCRLARASRPVALREVAEDGGLEALGFAMLGRRSDLALALDLAAVVDRSHGGPAFDVRYAHARGCGVLRAAARAMPDLDLSPAALSPAALAGADPALLSDAGEMAILRLVGRFPQAVAAAAAAREPHRVAVLTRELAGAVHRQWNRSKDQPQLRFVNEEQRDLTKARLGLVTASTLVLKSGLGILGVTAPEEMH